MPTDQRTRRPYETDHEGQGPLPPLITNHTTRHARAPQSELDMASWKSGARAAVAGDAASVQRGAYDFPVVPGPFDATALGRRQECQTLIGAEIVPKIHTLVRMPRRHATVWLATQALAIEVRPSVVPCAYP